MYGSDLRAEDTKEAKAVRIEIHFDKDEDRSHTCWL